MSVRIMTLVWDLDLSASQKIVLLALADCANDEGQAWPGITSLRQKCSKSERTVQTMLADLEAAGHITRHQVPGRGCKYQIHPGGKTPANSAPRKICTPQKTTRTPAEFAPPPAKSAPNPSKNRQEPSGGGARARADTAPVSKKGSSAGAPSGTRLPDDWAPPAIDDLSPMARNMVGQWPAGAFEASCEAFRLHWQNETGANALKRDWTGALSRWLIGDHPRFMRDARAGISFEAPAPAKSRKASATKPVAARKREDQRSWAIRDELARLMGNQTMDQWFGASALIHDGECLRVVCPSAFVGDWVRQHFAGDLVKAVRAAGIDRRSDEVRFEIEHATGDA